MRTIRHLWSRTACSLLVSGLALGGVESVFADDSTDAVGQVTAISGYVVAERPGERPRRLHCQDHVYRGERIVTSDRSRVGVLMDDVYAYLAPSTNLRVDRTPKASSDLTLESGGVRVIDPRNDGTAARLTALDASAEVLGNDTEAYIFSEKTGRYAMLCEWDAPLPVVRRDESVLANPGRCVLAKPKEPLYLADAHDERIALPTEDLCDRPIGALDLRLTPDVAAAPLTPWSIAGSAGPGLARATCDAGCPGVVVVVPPPVSPVGGFPGSGP